MWQKVVYLRSGRRRPVRVVLYRAGEDLQSAIPAGWCEKCGAEVYEFGEVLCDQCERWEKMKKRIQCELPPPCRGCTQVRNPLSCENKGCQLWRQWFINRWNGLRTYPRQEMDRTVPVGISIGGRRYLHPDDMRRYRRQDPCQGCGCPRDLCKTPCRAKMIWNSFIKEEK